MARVLFFLQLIVALVVLPLWPGMDARYMLWGLVFLGVVVGWTLGTVVAVQGAAATWKAITDAWSSQALGTSAKTSVEAWNLASRTFPVAGVAGGLAALTGALQGLASVADLSASTMTLVFFSLVWGFLGLLLGRIFSRVVTDLGRLPATKAVGAIHLNPAVSTRFGLTAREAETARCILDGLTYKDAAKQLSISLATIKSHLLSVYQKTGTGNKIELLRLVEAENARLHQTDDGLTRDSGQP